ncbi:hypothetical protein ACFLZB_03900 [Nanoarchaeota archaeon]
MALNFLMKNRGILLVVNFVILILTSLFFIASKGSNKITSLSVVENIQSISSNNVILGVVLLIFVVNLIMMIGLMATGFNKK